MPRLIVRQFACLKDNYGFLAHDLSSQRTAAIDTPDPDAYLREAAAAGWTITDIWNTHHHWDHAGGNAALKAATGARITAPAAEAAAIGAVDQPVSDGDRVRLGALEARVIATPGHTLGHVIYVFDSEAIAFVGDTLFALGCGRLFEGSPAQMWSSLSTLAALPPETTLYCAHEYTQANARFALSIEPENDALSARALEIDAKRAQGEPTVPMRLAEELATNPFLRAADPGLQAGLGCLGDPVETFAEIRRRKDVF